MNHFKVVFILTCLQWCILNYAVVIVSWYASAHIPVQKSKNLSPYYKSHCALFICAYYSKERKSPFPSHDLGSQQVKISILSTINCKLLSVLAPFWYRKSTFHNPVISHWIKSDIIESRSIFSFQNIQLNMSHYGRRNELWMQFNADPHTPHSSWKGLSLNIFYTEVIVKSML